MLDDDGQVTPCWLEKLIACGVRYDADLIGGPIIGALPPGAGILACNGVFARRQFWRIGPVDILITTQDLGISSALPDKLPPPLFQNHLGASGNDDYDLFRRSRQAGRVLAWCGEAEIVEPAPPERLTPAAALSCYWTTGVYRAKVHASYDGWRKTVIAASRGPIGSVGGAILAVLTRRNDRVARGLLSCVYDVGLVAGLVSARSSPRQMI